MLKAAIVSVSALVGGMTVYSATSVGSELATTEHATQTVSIESEANGHRAESTLWGIYGKHEVHICPVNNRETAEYVVEASKTDITPLMAKYGVTAVRDRYHSGLEHTFLWVIETTRPHDIEGFSIELGLASWNELTIVPLLTFEEGVVPMVAKLHGIDY